MKNVISENFFVNPEYDSTYFRTIEKINNANVQFDEILYDFAKRLFNTYGLGVEFIRHIYLLGYIQGSEQERNITLKK